MACILNDTMLRKLRCSACDKYLSVLPVKVYPNGGIKCGRCSSENDDGATSIYNKVAMNCFFKCVNRYEKCNKLLPVSEVEEHEKNCTGGTYLCPKCDYKFSGTAYQLVLHYTNQHPKSVLNYGSFSVKVARNFKETYFYLVKDNIFFVLVDNLAKDHVLYVSAVSLIEQNVKQWFTYRPLRKPARPTTTAVKPCLPMELFQCDYFSIPTNSMTEISFRVHLDLPEGTNIVEHISLTPLEPQETICTGASSKTDVATQSEPNETISVPESAQTLPVADVLGVKLTEGFEKEYSGYELTPCGTALFKGSHRIELACSNCKQLTGCNVFSCQLGKHVVCWDCKAWCGVCNDATDGWDVSLANINELLLLPCRWGCGEHFSGNHISQHELRCLKFGPLCPVCTCQCGNLELLYNHLTSVHRNYKNASRFNLTGYLKECGSAVGNVFSVYFFHNGYWFKLSGNKRGIVYQVTITPTRNTDLYELAIICDTGKKYNKIGSGSFEFVLSDNPRFYLKRIRNL